MAKRRDSEHGGPAALARGRLKRLPQEEDNWEADFHAVPKPMMQATTDYIGLVVTKRGLVLAETQVKGRPSANDFVALLAQAMRRPKTGPAHRPRRIYVRGHPQWQELFSHLQEMGISMSVRRELPKVQKAYEDDLRRRRKTHRAGMLKPTAEQATVETLFPAVAKWVRDYGHVEIGDQESFGFVVRALDYGGLVFEDDRPDTLAEALAALEEGLTTWFREEGEEN